MVSFLWVKLRWKTALLVSSEVLGLFVKTLPADDERLWYKRKKYLQANQIQLS